MPTDSNWEAQVKGLLKGELKRHGVTYKQLVEKLAAVSHGVLQQVLIHAGLGDKEGTLSALDRMTELGPVRVGMTLTRPELSFLRGDPRVKTLRKKVGLPE